MIKKNKPREDNTPDVDKEDLKGIFKKDEGKQKVEDSAITSGNTS